MQRAKTPKQRRERFHMRMAMMDKLSHLAGLSLIVGLLSAAVIILFRLLVEWIQLGFLDDPENYEGLAWYWRLLLPIAGGLLIGLLFHAVDKKYRAVGVVHAMERLAYHQANLPTGNAIMQFLGAAICIIFGQSVGREGPAIHLGAASGSHLGRWLHLPNNSTRTLVACGVAAAIAASFNTPLAGVIFSMEVVLMEYTLAGFIPVILASVSATSLSRVVFGPDPAFTVPALQLGSLGELPYVLLCGLIIGCLAALFIHALQFFSRQQTELPLWQRTGLAGIIVGLCAVLIPQVMSLGYDTVNAAMLGELGIGLLLAITFFKLLATTAGLGFGLPGGLIGPTLVIGACTGTACGLLASVITPHATSGPALYAMIGMGAMMGATLQAPLAALTALLELTANPHIILPGMLAIVSAGLVSSQLFNKESVFIMLMRARGMDYHESPVAQTLRRAGIANAMDRDFVSCSPILGCDAAQALLKNHPHWLVAQQQDEPPIVLPAADLMRNFEGQTEGEIDLAEIPAARRQTITIDLRATLQEGLESLQQHHADALLVVDTHTPGSEQVFGIVTREDIEQHYHYRRRSPDAAN
jgi:CIC family chloride channel protein